MKCPSCGVDALKTSVYCHKCGARLDLPTDPIAESVTAASPQADQTAPTEEPAAEQSSPSQWPAEKPLGAAERLKEAMGAQRDTAETPEEELWQGGYAVKAMMGAWIISGLVTVVLLAVGIWATINWGWRGWVWWTVLGFILVLWIYDLFVLARRRLSVHYRLTSQRFFHESGILRHTTDLIEVIDMDDVTYVQALIDRFTGVGTIHIASSDRSHPMLALEGIENVKEVARLMHEARHAERLRRGLHIEQI